MLPFNDPKKNVIANPLELPGSANDSSVHKVYGPKSIFRSGVLGNYEPDYKIKHGPGMYPLTQSNSSLSCELS
jgi:hypothetical protein